MRVLLLSSTLGFGHIKAAEAVEQALIERHPAAAVEYCDFWSLFDPAVAGAVKDGYLDVVTHQPLLYDRLYRFDSDHWREFFREPALSAQLDAVFERALQRWFPGRAGFPARGANLDQTLFLNLISTLRRVAPPRGNLIRRALVVWMHTLLIRRLKQRVQRFAPDVVISTQMMPSTVLAALKRRGELKGVPAVAVLTDYGVHDFWLRSNMDHYCVATEAMAAELRARGITRAGIAVTGIPLLPGFRQPLSQDSARRRLGIAAGSPTLLITGGGYGIGALEALQPILSAGLGYRILVAAGGGSGDSRLERLAAAHPERVRLYDHDTNMPLLVAAADVVIGKPGGLSVSEALACGRPFLAVCSLGGQESYNVSYLRRHDVGGPVDDDTLIERLRQWLRQPRELARVQVRAQTLGCRHGATAIVDSVAGEQGIELRQGREGERS